MNITHGHSSVKDAHHEQTSTKVTARNLRRIAGIKTRIVELYRGTRRRPQRYKGISWILTLSFFGRTIVPFF